MQVLLLIYHKHDFSLMLFHNNTFLRVCMYNKNKLHIDDADKQHTCVCVADSRFLLTINMENLVGKMILHALVILIKFVVIIYIALLKEQGSSLP